MLLCRSRVRRHELHVDLSKCMILAQGYLLLTREFQASQKGTRSSRPPAQRRGFREPRETQPPKLAAAGLGSQGVAKPCQSFWKSPDIRG